MRKGGLRQEAHPSPMPELPEVENVRLQLTRALHLPLRCARVELYRSGLRFEFPPGLERAITGSRLIALSRRSKYVLFQFETGVLLAHLGMTGQWRVERELSQLRHDHARLVFVPEPGASTPARSEVSLVFNDPRRFGFFDWMGTEESGTAASNRFLRVLGPEPLSPEFGGATLARALRGRRASIKSSLMNASVVVGVGNIYASEALHRAGVRPTRAAGRLRQAQYDRLAECVRQVLSEAIEAGGSTIRDYRGADQEPGRFQSRHRVYGRAGLPCFECGTPIRRIVQQGRSSFYCPSCQR